MTQNLLQFCVWKYKRSNVHQLRRDIALFIEFGVALTWIISSFFAGIYWCQSLLSSVCSSSNRNFAGCCWLKLAALWHCFQYASKSAVHYGWHFASPNARTFWINSELFLDSNWKCVFSSGLRKSPSSLYFLVGRQPNVNYEPQGNL